jgi:hypothetical protein
MSIHGFLFVELSSDVGQIFVRCSSNFRPTLVRLSSDVRRTSVRRWSNFRPMFVEFPADVGQTSVRCSSNFRSIGVLRPTFCHPMFYVFSSCLFIRHPFNFHPTFISPSFNVHLTSVQCPFVVGHSRQRTIFFKPYIVLELCS